MAEWVRALTALLLFLHTTSAEIPVTQDQSISTSPGQTVKITCTLTEGSLSYPSWYWQKPDSVPVLVWYGSTRASGIPDRFTGTTDSSRNQMHLTITNVRSADAADYHCLMWTGSRYIFGKGTKLNLGSPQPPAVTVLPPSEDEISGKNTATLVCLVNGFNPGAVDIEWTVDGSARSDGVETSRIQQETDNTFSASSYLTLPATVWNSHGLYSCVVKHETQAIPLKTNIARSSCM
ncbi:immunoglobulin lambda-1 light chain-like [Rhinoraja longicauda]